MWQHGAKGFSYHSFNAHLNPMREILLSQFYIWENQCSERLSHLSRVTRLDVKDWASLFPSSYFVMLWFMMSSHPNKFPEYWCEERGGVELKHKNSLEVTEQSIPGCSHSSYPSENSKLNFISPWQPPLCDFLLDLLICALEKNICFFLRLNKPKYI